MKPCPFLNSQRVIRIKMLRARWRDRIEVRQKMLKTKKLIERRTNNKETDEICLGIRCQKIDGEREAETDKKCSGLRRRKQISSSFSQPRKDAKKSINISHFQEVWAKCLENIHKRLIITKYYQAIPDRRHYRWLGATSNGQPFASLSHH